MTAPCRRRPPERVSPQPRRFLPGRRWPGRRLPGRRWPWRFLPLLCNLALAACGPSSLSAAAPSGLFPFVLPWDDASPGVANVSAWNNAPAGKEGPIIERGGHLYEGADRIRFLGVNVAYGACFPSHDEAGRIGARLAKFGINAVRFHHMDTEPSPNGLLARDGRSLDADQLDRLDYFISELKKNGIYTDLNLHVGRIYPGMRRWKGMPQYFKGVDLFFPAMIRMQKSYARDLLTHVNPYTGASYADEPSVAFVELNTEDGLMHEWWTGSLDGMPGVYADELTRQWRAWLDQQYPTTSAFRQAWGMADQPAGAEMLAPLSSASAWTLQVSPGAKATDAFSPVGPDKAAARVVQVLTPGREAWDVQMYQAGIAVGKDQVYTLSVWAKASATTSLQLNVMQAHEPWRLLWSAPLNLTQNWRKHRFSFLLSEGDDNARVTLGNLGAAPGTYWFSQASLAPGGTIGLPAGKGVESVDFFRRTDFDQQGAPAQRDWIRFLWQEEEDSWTGMTRYLKEELGAHALVIGTQADFSPAPLQAELDVVDNHGYWQHPRFPHAAGDPADWLIIDTPMAGSVDGGEISRLSLQRVIGKPYIVSEYNHSAPNTFSSEAFLLICAYAAMQDWDGVFAFDYGDTRDDWDSRRITGYFPIDQHPAKMVTLPAAAALFRRGDVSSLEVSRPAVVSVGDAILWTLQKGPAIGADAFGVGRTDALEGAVGLAAGTSGATDAGPPSPQDASSDSPNLSLSPAPAPLPGSYVTSNGELTWDSHGGKGYVTVSTPRSKAAIGYVLNRTFDLGGITVAPGRTIQDWAAISLTAMGPGVRGNLLSRGSILVTATGFIQNTGMGWKNAERTTVGRDWGRAPTLVEGIPATIILPVTAHRVEAFALDERGQRGRQLPVADAAGKASIQIGPDYRTLWYEIVIR